MAEQTQTQGGKPDGALLSTLSLSSLNERALTIGEVEELLSVAKSPMYMSDYDPAICRHVWANKEGLLLLEKKDSADLRTIDLVSGTSETERELHNTWYTKVQVGHETVPEANITNLPGGAETSISVVCVPVRVTLPAMQDTKVLCLSEIRAVERKTEEGRVTPRALADQRIRSDEILSHSDILTLLFDEEGRLHQANKKATNFYFGAGKTPHEMGLEELLDSCVWDSEDERVKMQLSVLDMFQTSQPLQISKKKKRSTEEGKQIWHLITFIACRDPVTERPALLVNEADISAHKETSMQLVDAQRAREAFFTAVAHELRTPLNGIMGLAGALVDDETAPQAVQDKLRVIKSSCSRLAHVVGDILDAANFSGGSISLNTEEVSLREVAENAVEAMSPLVRSGICLENKVPEDLPLIEGDKSRIEQCLVNLIGNALQFTRLGRVWVSGCKVSASEVAIRVSDTGSGIPQEKITQIFTGPATLSTETAKLVGLSGLGLPLVKMLVEGHNGSINCSSTVASGTVFTITLPIRQHEPESSILKGPFSSSASLKGLSDLGPASTPGSDPTGMPQSPPSATHSPISAGSARNLRHRRYMGSLDAQHQQRGSKKSLFSESDTDAGSESNPRSLTQPQIRRALSSPEGSHARDAALFNGSNDRAHVLTVEDDAISSLVLERMLEIKGYKVTSLSSGEEAIQFLLSGETLPDLVFADVDMAGMNGYELLALARQEYSPTVLPIVLLTGDPVVEALKNGLPCGANDAMQKPVSQEELHARVETHVEQKRMQARLLAKGSPITHGDEGEDKGQISRSRSRTSEQSEGSMSSIKQGGSHPVGPRSSIDATPATTPKAPRNGSSEGEGELQQELMESLMMGTDLRAELALERLAASRRERQLMRKLEDKEEQIGRLTAEKIALERSIGPLNEDLKAEQDLVEATLQNLEEKTQMVWALETKMGFTVRCSKFTEHGYRARLQSTVRCSKFQLSNK